MYGYLVWEVFGIRYSIFDLGVKFFEIIFDFKEFVECFFWIVFVCERFGGLVVKVVFINLEKVCMDYKILELWIVFVIFFEIMYWVRVCEKSSLMKFYEVYEFDVRVFCDL